MVKTVPDCDGRNRIVCMVKIGEHNIQNHHRNFGPEPVAFHDGECIYKTLTEGLTLTGL